MSRRRRIPGITKDPFVIKPNPKRSSTVNGGIALQVGSRIVWGADNPPLLFPRFGMVVSLYTEKQINLTTGKVKSSPMAMVHSHSAFWVAHTASLKRDFIEFDLKKYKLWPVAEWMLVFNRHVTEHDTRVRCPSCNAAVHNIEPGPLCNTCGWTGALPVTPDNQESVRLGAVPDRHPSQADDDPFDWLDRDTQSGDDGPAVPPGDQTEF
jgi:hypothetical protein